VQTKDSRCETNVLNLISQRLDTICQIKPKRATILFYTFLHLFTQLNTAFIALCMHKQTSRKFGLVCVYGDPHHQRTVSIWSQVRSFVVTYPNLPVLCKGDLNNIMSASEKMGPVAANLNCIARFCCLIKDCGLFDLGYNRPAYTWTNKRFSSNPTYERLDRCLGNAG
jgi:hypothetical protein